MKQYLTLIILPLLLSGCKPYNHKAIYFEYYSYSASCFSERYYGWIMDQDGNILSYQKPQMEVPADMNGYVAPDSIDKFISRCNTVIGKINVHEVAKHKDLIASVVLAKTIKEGRLTYGDQRCCYYCYWYDPIKRKYKKILLREQSQCSLKNIHPNAKTLESWMYAIGSEKCQMMNPDSFHVIIRNEKNHFRRHRF